MAIGNTITVLFEVLKLETMKFITDDGDASAGGY